MTTNPRCAPRSPETTADPRMLAAWHEAGHAVAAVMRGGSELLSVALGEHHGTGLTWHRSASWDGPFIAYAGPWAEARYLWGERPHEEPDEDDLYFNDYLMGVLLAQPSDAEAVTAWETDRPWVTPDLVRATERIWWTELERVWSAIAAVAERLLADATVSHDEVASLVELALEDGLTGDT